MHEPDPEVQMLGLLLVVLWVVGFLIYLGLLTHA